MSKLRNAQGFTLIELLIAVSIITVAFGVIISSSGAIQRNSRDSQRQSDLRNLQSILQQYYADQNYYPSGCCNTPFSLDGSTQSTLLSSSIGTPTPPAQVKTYSTRLPVEPNPDQRYCYRAYNSQGAMNADATSYNCDNSSTNRCQFYLLCTRLENAPATISSACQTACGGEFNLEINPLK